MDVTVVELLQEKDELQAEISELQLLVEDLKTKVGLRADYMEFFQPRG